MRIQILTAAALTCLLATPSYAQTATGTGTGISGSNSESGAVAIGGGNANATGTGVGISNSESRSASGSIAAGNQVNITSPGNIRTHTTVSGTQTIKSAPSMVAPGLTAAGLETCLGSASGTVSAVGFGIGGGSTYKDEDCTARLDSRTLYAMGLKGAAVARLCQRPDVWRSMPDVCQQYWPVGVPLPYGIVIAAPAPRITMSADGGGSGAMRVVDGRDGVEKDCLNYSAGKQKCYQWAGEPMHRSMQRIAAVQPQKKLPPAAAKPKPAPKVEPAKVEPPKTEPPKEAPKT